MWQSIVKGGPVMIPIVLCSLVVLTIIIERAIYFYTNRFKIKEEWPVLQRLMEGGRWTETVQVLNDVGGLGKEMIGIAISSVGQKNEVIEARMGKAAQKELAAMEKGLYWLEVIVTIAPLLGLLGTVTGIIRSFNVLSVALASNPNALSAGIAEALITTAAGLIIAVPAYVFYCYYQNLIQKRINTLNSLGEEVLVYAAGEVK